MSDDDDSSKPKVSFHATNIKSHNIQRWPLRCCLLRRVMACTPKPKGDPSVAASIAAAFFKLVIVIEVSYEDDSFRESFTNTDIHRLASKRFIVKYDNLMADEKIMKKLREVIGLHHLCLFPQRRLIVNSNLATSSTTTAGGRAT